MRRVRLRRRGIVTIVLAILAIGVAFAFISRTGRQMAGSIAAKLALGDKPINILLIANNARGVAADDPLGLGTAAGQADVVLLAHLDPAAHAIDAITIPRDALTAQPDWHNPIPKIKTLLFMGDQDTPPDGPKYLSQAVEKLTGLPIDGYVVANFAGFKAAVDAVGGLTVDVKARVYDPVNSGADFAPGIQHMNGAQALAFVRVRQNQAGNGYRVNDFQRMQAEVQVLGLLRDKLLNPAHATTLIPTFVRRMT
ncbi:MAG: LCP family protein, partial [Vulcanimicrobiaceae bacterium]